MNKADLVNEISSRTGLTKTKTNDVVDAIVESIQGALAKGEKVTLVGFGTFDTIVRKERKGRNPKTGEKIPVPPKKLPFFKVGKELKERIDKIGEGEGR